MASCSGIFWLTSTHIRPHTNSTIGAVWVTLWLTTVSTSPTRAAGTDKGFRIATTRDMTLSGILEVGWKLRFLFRIIFPIFHLPNTNLSIGYSSSKFVGWTSFFLSFSKELFLLVLISSLSNFWCFLNLDMSSSGVSFLPFCNIFGVASISSGTYDMKTIGTIFSLNVFEFKSPQDGFSSSFQQAPLLVV